MSLVDIILKAALANYGSIEHFILITNLFALIPISNFPCEDLQVHTHHFHHEEQIEPR